MSFASGRGKFGWRCRRKDADFLFSITCDHTVATIYVPKGRRVELLHVENLTGEPANEELPEDDCRIAVTVAGEPQLWFPVIGKFSARRDDVPDGPMEVIAHTPGRFSGKGN